MNERLIDDVEDTLQRDLQEINDFKPLHLRAVDDNHPVVEYADNMARSYEETGDAVEAEAKAKKQTFYEYARVIREQARKHAAEVNDYLARVHRMGVDLESAWSNYGKDSSEHH